MSKFTHFDQAGNAQMVDITDKQKTERMAVASGTITTNETVIEAITNRNIEKGDVLTIAQVAGINAIKHTALTIPLCHPLLIDHAKIEFEIDKQNCQITATCTVKVSQATGVEMEALHGASVALLTIYDMCKAVDKRMVISDLKLDYKHGGKSGVFKH